MIVVLPVVLYPVVGFAVVQLMLHFADQTRLVGINGIENLPANPPLLAATYDRFESTLFENAKAHRSLRILPAMQTPDLPPVTNPPSNSRKKTAATWTKADLNEGKIDVLVEIPPNFASELQAGRTARIRIVRNPQADKSLAAGTAVGYIFSRWQSRVVAERMKLLDKSADYAAPVSIEEDTSVTIGPSSHRSGTIWGKVLPFVLVVMALTGAFYPAIDLCAGEKERGTMETLLITPAARSEIVLGKFLTIAIFSIGTTVFNLMSMGLTIGQVSGLAPKELPAVADALAAPTFVSVLWMLVLMLPLAAFFSAMCMALAIFAKSTKEGQYYLMPVFLIVLPLVVLTLLPGVELNAFYSLVPVANVALLLRSLMNNRYEIAAVYFLPVLLPTALYGYLALRFAVDRFEREDVIFREAERFDMWLWLKRVLETKSATPSVGEALTCFGLLIVLQYYVQGRLPLARWSLIVSQLSLILFPAVLMAIVLTTRPGRTLGFRRPALLPSILTILMAITFHPVAANIGGEIQRWMPLSEDISERLTQLLGDIPLSRRLLIFAVLPAVCEEIAFRGFILSGLLSGGAATRAIATSAVFFGLFHMLPQQMFLTVMVGVLLGIVATRTGSIFPGMIFHAMHNGMMILLGSKVEESTLVKSGGVFYSYPVFVMGALATAVLAGLLYSMRARLPTDKNA